MSPSDDIPPEVRALVRETFLHTGNAATDGRPWNLYTAMRFAELCVVADRAAHTPDAAVLREALSKVRDAILSSVNSDAITDTIWMPEQPWPIETVVDFIDAALASPAPITKTAIAEHDEPDAGVGEGWRDVLAERKRQVEAEGWTPEHDDEHEDGELSLAAACYASPVPLQCEWPVPSNARSAGEDSSPFRPMEWGPAWPWEDKWWKPTDRRRNLVKAGALILAEIERIGRAAAPSQEQPNGK